MNSKKNTQLNFFLCPASDYLNQHNETGSHGLLSYQFIRHLAMKETVNSIFAVVMMSMPVTSLPKTRIVKIIHKSSKNPSLHDFDSLLFYLKSFFQLRNSRQFKQSDIVHHIIPFKFGRTFNLFFLWRSKSKKYIIGPIVSPHLDEKISADEEYVFVEKKQIKKLITERIINLFKITCLGLFGKVLYFLSSKTLQNADILIFSDNYSLNYHKQYLQSSQTVFTMDTGIDVSTFKPSRFKKKKRRNDNVNVLFVGRLTMRKGCEYLIKALSQAIKVDKNIKIHCHILGYGPLQAKLEALVKELRLSDHITFLPGVKNEELVKYYHTADIVCIPALSDTFTVIKESMSSGTPVIVTDVCSHAERVIDGVNGYIVPPRSSKAIADVLLKITRDPESLNSLSQQASQVRPTYDWNNILDKYLKNVQ